MGFTRINSPLYPPTRCNKWLACLWMGAISTYWWGYLHQPTVHSITCPCPNTLARAAVYAVICLHRWYVLSQIQLYALTTNGAVKMTVIKSPTKRGVQVPGISAVAEDSFRIKPGFCLNHFNDNVTVEQLYWCGEIQSHTVQICLKSLFRINR